VTRVHQFHPVLGPGDAMSNHVFALQERLRGWGHDAHAYAIEAKTGAQDVLPYRRLFRDVGSDDLVLLHFSMGNEVFTQLAKLRARKVLVYHNVTPAEFFRGINAHAATHARLGRRQLVELAPAMDLAIGVSAYNQHELDAAGYARTAHVPILIDWRQYDQHPTMRSWRAGTGCGRCSCSSAACRRTSARTTSSGCSRTTARASIRTRASCSSAATATSRSTTHASSSS